MGYACPVCDAPQRDETHLANHLALQAIVHGDDHETWLDDHATDWNTMNPESLGPVVAEFAEEREFDEVFEDTVDRRGSHGHQHDHGHGFGHDHGTPQQFSGREESQPLSGDAARIFEEARSLTEEMHDDGDADASRTDDEHGDDDADEKES
ncbi:hypothetical protein C440_05168 [Haloferax mucosum ATCC BAA-1512]|uniref:Uncharacterized protein n=1 Tax=Haloferax mucosum ATCC BAA-1512 TaxID=662479 RepID=M0IIC0_9EURY|nr:DUF5810 domain-containing protein [Haloferax mucosum]ELZ96511.1 hypothetical protein C440_05168 [Haloferax mucosum ATCC BAA-1512]